MDAKEIVLALRNERYERPVLISTVRVLEDAADCIERLQSQLAEYEHELQVYQEIIVPELRSQLAETQPREKALRRGEDESQIRQSGEDSHNRKM